MSSFLFRKRASVRCWVVLSRNPKPEAQLGSLIKPPEHRNVSSSVEIPRVLDSGSSSFSSKALRTISGSVHYLRNLIGSGESFGLSSKVRSVEACGLVRCYGTQAAQEPSTSDGLTVDQILNSEWSIHEEDESDWKSHAAAIAQSIHLIKKRLQIQLMITACYCFKSHFDA